jgi:hypothetical protein
MRIADVIGMDTLLHWAEVSATILTIAMLAGVLVFIAVVLRISRHEPRRAVSDDRARMPG